MRTFSATAVLCLILVSGVATAAPRHHKAHAAPPAPAAAPAEVKTYMQIYPESSGNRFRTK